MLTDDDRRRIEEEERHRAVVRKMLATEARKPFKKAALLLAATALGIAIVASLVETRRSVTFSCSTVCTVARDFEALLLLAAPPEARGDGATQTRYFLVSNGTHAFVTAEVHPRPGQRGFMHVEIATGPNRGEKGVVWSDSR